MAKYNSNILSEISGKLGDLVFGRNKQGRYVSKLGNPREVTSEKQKESFARFSLVNNMWVNLKREEIKAWEYIAKGSVFSKDHLQAINIFNKLNLNLLNIDEDLIRKPPILDLPTSPIKLEIEIKYADSILNISLSPESGVKTKLVLYATKPKNLGVNSVSKEYKKVCVIDYKCVKNRSILKEYKEVFGDGSFENKKIFIKLKPIHIESGMDVYPTFGIGEDGEI